MQPTYYVKHPDGSYSEAKPQPVLDAEIENEGELNCTCLTWPGGPDYCLVHAA